MAPAPVSAASFAVFRGVCLHLIHALVWRACLHLCVEKGGGVSVLARRLTSNTVRGLVGWQQCLGRRCFVPWARQASESRRRPVDCEPCNEGFALARCVRYADLSVAQQHPRAPVRGLGAGMHTPRCIMCCPMRLQMFKGYISALAKCLCEAKGDPQSAAGKRVERLAYEVCVLKACLAISNPAGMEDFKMVWAATAEAEAKVRASCEGSGRSAHPTRRRWTECDTSRGQPGHLDHCLADATAFGALGLWERVQCSACLQASSS
jgi:hypothetical protein